jgi:carboxymethylenebutenolidase
MPHDDGYVTLEVEDGTTMRAFVARPAPSERAPGMILIQEAFGVNPQIRDVAERLARLGFVAIAPEMFHRTAPAGWVGPYDDFPAVMPHVRALTADLMIADLRAAHAWLAHDPGADASRIAALGFCMGGRAAYLANSALPLVASVSFYGGSIAPALLDRAASAHGPQLLFWAGEDRTITPEQHRAVADAFRAAGKTFVDVEFSGVPHGFFSDQRDTYRPVVAAQAWALTRAFLEQHVLDVGRARD